MKYHALNRKNAQSIKTFEISGFDGGINCENGDYAQDGSVLIDCENMYFEDGVLKTRDGFCANENSVTEFLEYNDRVYLPFTVSETVYYMNSKPYSLAYSCTGDDTEAYLRFFLVDAKGNVSPAGSIYIHRVMFDTFYIPQNVFFVVASKIEGNGVFAYVARKAQNDAIYEVYEAQENFSEWQLAKYYVPTVLINGRGERYEQAKGYVELDYPEPERLEELNLLNGRYRCYFTSDDLSSIFRLPYENIDSLSSLECRLYSSSEEYTEWSIGPYENTATAKVAGADVYLYVNRTIGTIRFYTRTQDYSVPIMPGCKLNNIMVTTNTLQNYSKDSIITSKSAVMLNNRLYFYGNKMQKNCIYCSKITNPLYVPESSKLYLGDSSTPVIALKVQNGKLIAFKSGETYRISTSFDDSTIQREAVLPESTLYVRGDTMSAQTIDNNIGCVNEKTIRLCGSRLVWLSGDKNIYALATTTYGNTTNIYRVSQPLGSRIKEMQFDMDDAFAVTKDGKYMLFLGDTVFVMNYRVRGFGYSRTYYAEDDKLKSPAWYIWRLPEGAGFYGASELGSNALIFSSFHSGNTFYLLTVSGKEDTLMNYENYENVTVTFPIKSGLSTKTIEFGDQTRLKRIDSMFIGGNSSDYINLSITDGTKKYHYKMKFGSGADVIKTNAGIPFSGGIGLSLSSEKPFAIRNIALKYKLLADRG